MRGISCNTKESSGRSHSLTKEDGTWDLSRGDPVTENVLDNIVNSGFPFHLKKIELSGLMIPKVFFGSICLEQDPVQGRKEILG